MKTCKSIWDPKSTDWNWEPIMLMTFVSSRTDDQEGMTHFDPHSIMFKAWCTKHHVQWKSGVVCACFWSKGHVQVVVNTRSSQTTRELSRLHPRSRSYLTTVQDFLVVSQGSLQIFQMWVCVPACIKLFLLDCSEGERWSVTGRIQSVGFREVMIIMSTSHRHRRFQLSILYDYSVLHKVQN